MKGWRTVFTRLLAGERVVVEARRNAVNCARGSLKLRGFLPPGFSLHTRHVPGGRLELFAGLLKSPWAVALSRLKEAGDRVRISGRTRYSAHHALKRYAAIVDRERVRIDEDEDGVWLTLLAQPRPNLARAVRGLAVGESVVSPVAAANMMYRTANRVHCRYPQRRFHTHVDRAAGTVKTTREE